MRNFVNFMILISGIMFFTMKSAFAYLDLGSGSMLLQILFSGVAGAVIIIRIYWNRIKKFLSIINKKNNEK